MNRNIAYYAKENNGKIEEFGQRPVVLPYPIVGINFDANGNALDGSVTLAAAQLWPVDEVLNNYIHDIIDNHPEATAVRPIYKNVTYSVINNQYPDDTGYNPSLHGTVGVKSHDTISGNIVEYGTRPNSLPVPIIGVFDVLGNALMPGSDTDGKLDIDDAMTMRIRKWIITHSTAPGSAL